MKARIAAPLGAILFLVTSLARAQPPVVVADAALGKRLAIVVARPAFQHASVGILVRSLRTGKVLYEHNADLALVPASNEKILTALTALHDLGTAFTFRTAVLSTVKPDATGTLAGDLYLRGSGDPSLSSERLEEMARAVARAGTRRVVGRIVADDTAFDQERLGNGWQWDDEPYYYSPQVSGVNCDENVVTVAVCAGARTGDPVSVTINGRLAGEETFFTVACDIRTTSATGGAVADVAFGRARGTNRIVITGTTPAAAKEVSEQITVEDPARFAASRFVLALAKAGVIVNTPLWIESGATPPGAMEITFGESKPLAELLKDFLKPSDNLYGEALLKAIGHAVKPGSPGSIAGGRVRVESFLDAARVDRGGLNIADGSGLSLQNTVTARLIGAMLAYADTRMPRDQRDAFWDGLPIGGVDGTISGRFRDSASKGRVRAKTGTLFGASSLSGYVTARSGERLVFSILMNHAGSAAEARRAQDAIVAALIDR